LETLVVNEIRAFIAYNNLHYELHFWRSYNGPEVDVLCETRTGFVAIEVKAARAWQRRFGRGLKRVRAEMRPQAVRTYGVCLCERSSVSDETRVLPAGEFLRSLWSGDIIA